MKSAILYGAIGALVLNAGTVYAGDDHEHEGDFFVAKDQSADPGASLTGEFDFDEPTALPAIDAAVVGWFGDDPGFAVLDEDEPDEGFWMIGADADIHFELVGTSSSAMKVWDPLATFSPGTEMQPGDTFAFGAGNDFDEHPFWHIDSADPSFAGEGAVYWVDVKLVDMGTTAYGDSPTYRFEFVTPAPGSVLALGAFAMIRRRR